MLLQSGNPLFKVIFGFIRGLVGRHDERLEAWQSGDDFTCARREEDAGELDDAAQVVSAVEVGRGVGNARAAGDGISVDMACITVAADGDEGVEVGVFGGVEFVALAGGPGEEAEAEGGLSKRVSLLRAEGKENGGTCHHGHGFEFDAVAFAV